MASDECIAEVLIELSDSFPTFEFTEGRVKVWAKYLKDYDDALLRASVEQFISTSQTSYPPSIPQIRDCATQLRIQILNIPSALEAWDEVLLAKKPNPSNWKIVKEGQFVEDVPYRWSNPLVERVAVMLGWPSFPNSSEVSVDRAHFIKQYDQMVAKAVKVNLQIPQVKEYVEKERLKGAQPMLEGRHDVSRSLSLLSKKLESNK